MRPLTWVWHWIVRGVGWLFRDLDVHAPVRDVAGRVLLSVAAIITIWLLVRLARIALGTLRSVTDRTGITPRSAPARTRTAEEWEALAREAGASERWREASIALYHAVILRLGAAGRLRPNASKTPGDYRREVARSLRAPETADIAAGVAAFLRAFERVAFAAARPRADDYERLRALAEPLGAHG